MTQLEATASLLKTCWKPRVDPMDERTLQALSKALTLLIFRNSIIEDLHTDGTCLDDADMTRLNRDINNRFYTLLTLWFYGTDEETERLERTLNFLAKNYGNDWDKAERVELLMWRYDSTP